MTVSSSNSKTQSTGNGSVLNFPYNFQVYEQTQLEVYLNDDLQVSGYTVAGVGNPVGGTVSFTVAPSAGVQVTCLRNVPITQEIDYTAYDPFPAETHERALDLGVMVDQQLQEQINRSLKLAVSTVPGDLVIDSPIDAASLAWDLSIPGVYKIVNGPPIGNISGSVAAAEAAALAAENSAALAAAAANEALLARDEALAAAERALDIVSNVRTAPYTLAITDRGKSIDTTAGVTVPPSATVDFPIGAVVSVTNTSAVAIPITQGAGVLLRVAGTVTTGSRTLAPFGMATLRQVTADLWFITGVGLS